MATLFVGPVMAQTCNSAATLAAPDSRFQDNGDGTVSDLQTSLMWQQCSIGQSGVDCATGSETYFTWDLALQQGEALNSSGGFAGYTDWRLPNIKELRSLVEYACNAPSINISFFPNTPGLIYWSSSPYAPYSDYVWIVYFNDGTSDNYRRNTSHSVRLVRSGQ